MTENIFENIPVLDIGDRVGNTGYIDFIEIKNVKYPIMSGVDKYRRPFFVLKMIMEYGTKSVEYFQTFFQRYNDNVDLWMGANKYDNSLIETSGGINGQQWLMIIDLLQNIPIELNTGDEDFHEYRLLKIPMEYNGPIKIYIDDTDINFSIKSASKLD